VQRFQAGEVARVVAEDLNVLTSQVIEWAHEAGVYKRGPRRRLIRLHLSRRRLELLVDHFRNQGAALECGDDGIHRLRKGTR
jgi:hypothetical protein